MSIVVPGLDSFVQRVCAADAVTTKARTGYVSVVAGKASSRCRQIERIDSWKNSEDLASQIEDAIEPLQREHKVFGAYFYDADREGDGPDVTMKWYYSSAYKEESQLPSVVDRVQDEKNPQFRDLQAGALAQIAMDNNRLIPSLLAGKDDLWLQIMDLHGENERLKMQIRIYKAVSGVEKWNVANEMLKNVLGTVGPIAMENAGKGFDAAKDIGAALKAHYEAMQAREAQERGEKPEPKTDEDRLDNAVDALVEIFGKDLPKFATIERLGKLFPTLMALYEYAVKQGWIQPMGDTPKEKPRDL